MNDLFKNAQTFMGVESVNSDDLFGEDTGEGVKIDTQEEGKPETKETKEDTIPEGGSASAEDIFGEDDPESVGDDDNKEEGEAEPQGKGSSPKDENLYSSFAQALKGDGLFQFLDDETVGKIDDADSFREALENEVDARLDEQTRRYKEALESGMQPEVIVQYQNTIQRLESITDEQIDDESEQGANLRRTLLFRDFVNRGFSEERAKRQVERIMSSGTDKDDAKDALESIKEYFKDKYQEQLDIKKQEAEAEKQRVKKEAEDFKQAVLEKDKLFEDIPVDKPTRKKAYEAMTRVVKTTDDGEQLTAVQLYADEHPVEFRTALGIVWALTDGFTKMGNLLQKSVNKKVNKNLQEIESRLRNQGHQGGSFRFSEGEEGGRSTNNYKGFRIDI